MTLINNLETEKPVVIKCPHCGYEYVPSELFMPTDLEGKSETIIRDALGKILYVEYDDEYKPGKVAKYYCDGCGKAFIVEPQIVYRSKQEEIEKDFSDLTVSLI